MDDSFAPLPGGQLPLLTGLPGTEKTHLARTIVARLQEQVEPVHCSAQNLAWGRRRRPLGAQVRGRAAWPA